MAKIDQLVHLDMNNNQIQNVSFQTLAIPPVTTNLPIGWFYWNTADKTTYAWTGTEWKDLGANYVHPTYITGNIPTVSLTGAVVPSKFSVENGHLTAIETRTLTPANIGAASANHNHTSANITALTDYALGTDTPIVATDSLNTALGKIQKQIDSKTNNVGTVTSVNLSAPTGFDVSGGPITESGTLNFAYASGYQGYTTAEATKLNGIQAGANNYVLPTASGTVLGGVKVGQNLAVDANGVLNASFTETDPLYTASIPNQMMYKGQISSDSDLNNYTETGSFVCAANANAATVLNSPTTIGFLLEVVRHASTLIYQKLQVQTTGKIFTRSLRTSWTSWKETANTDDLNNYIPTTHAANNVTTAKIANWDTAYGWGDYRQFGLGANSINVTNVSQIGHVGKLYRMLASATGNTMGAGAFLNIPFQGGQTMMLKLLESDASVGSIDSNNVVTKHYGFWTSRNLTAGTLTSLNTVAETVDKIWSSKNLNDWLNSKSYATTTQLTGYIPTTHVVNAITQTNINNWNSASTNNHTHTNKAVLDGITAGLVTNWNTAHTYSQVGHLPLAGGTMTGDINLTNGPTTNGIVRDMSGNIGNWSRKFLRVNNTNENSEQIQASLGIYGTPQTIGYWYFGNSYDDSTLKITNDGKLGVNMPGIIVPTANLDVRGTVRFQDLKSGLLRADTNGNLSIDNTAYMTTAHAANNITASLMANWSTAFSWGDHAGKYLSVNGGLVNGNVRLNSGSTNVIPASGSAITNYALSIGTPTNGMQIGSLANGQGYIQQTRIDGTATNYILNLNPNGGQVKVGSGGFESGGTIKFSGLGAGFVKSSADGTLSVDNTSYATATELGNRIPYTGADKAIDFGYQMVNHEGIKREASNSIESPWLTANPTSTSKVTWLIIDNLTPINANRQFVIEVESISGNGNVIQLKKHISLWLNTSNNITNLNEKFVHVLGVASNEKRFTIGTPEKNTDTSIKVPIIWLTSAPQTKSKITLKATGGTPFNNITFSTLNDAESTLTGVAPRDTEDNYIGVDNNQLNLSGDKKTSGQWTFDNAVNIGTDTSEAQLTIKGDATTGRRYRQLALSNTDSSQKLFAGVIAEAQGSYLMNNSYYHSSNEYRATNTSASGINMRGNGSIDFFTNTGLTSDTNYTPTVRLKIGNDGKVTVANLAGTGERMVVALASGELVVRTTPSAQVLSLGAEPGQITLSGGGGFIRLDTLHTKQRQDSNVRVAAHNFTAYHSIADSTNYPGPTGNGIRAERLSGPTSQSGFDIHKIQGDDKLFYKTFDNESNESTWKTIADREWVTAENFLKTVNLGYTATATNGTITNTGGTNTTIPAATSSMAGLMLPAEKTKLYNIEANANNYLHPTANPGTHPFSTEITSGVQVLSQLVVNNEGHVVTVKGRNLTAADLASVMINNASNTATNQTWSASKIYTEVQAAINQAQTGALQYKGDYNPATNTPSITTDATVKTGFTYVVTATGTFTGQTVEAGDMIIAKINNPGATAANWQIVNKNIPAIVDATASVKGIIQLATNAEAIAGTNATKAITPATLKAAMDAAVGGFSIAFGNGSSTNFDITHGLNTQFVTVVIYRASDMRQVIMQVAPTSASIVNIQCNTAPTNNQYIVVIKK